MVERAADSGLRAVSWPAILPFLVAAALYAVMLAAGRNFLNDPDSFWHLSVGRWIIENHGFPHTDPFSLTFAGQPWIAKEWLSQLLYLGAFDIAGWNGMVVLAAGSIALAFGLLTRLLIARLSLIASLTFAALAFVLSAPHLMARPHALALPVMVGFVGGLLRASDRQENPPLFLLPLMVLWANLHGGFTLGILLTAAIGLDAVVSTAPGSRLARAKAWGGFFLLTLLAACITPYGPESMLVTYRILSLGPVLGIIGEWRPADLAHFGPLEISVLLGVGLALYRGFRLPVVRMLILLGLLHLAFSADRNAEILGFLAPLLLARPLAEQFAALRAEADTMQGSGEWIGIAGSVGFLVAATVVFFGMANLSPNPRIAPTAAVAAIRQAGIARVLNDYDFGGFLIYSGLPPFIDGRSELYGADFTRRHYRAVTLADLNDFVGILDHEKIGATLLSPQTPAVELLDRLPGWRRLYADDVAVVHVRD